MSALKSIRLRHCLSQYDLADLIGVRQGTIHKIETGGRRPSVPVLVDLADALKLDDEDLGRLARTLTTNNQSGGRRLTIPVLVNLADALSLDDARLGQLARTLTTKNEGGE